MTKLIICAYNKIGCDVLKHVVNRNDITALAVFTHNSPEFIPNVQELCKQYDIWVSTENINKSELPFKPDIISSVYYRYIIKPWIIEICNNKIFNIHPSLLPKHRGCSSVPWAIIEGDNITGVTFHYVDRSIDTGNIILQASIQIDQIETQYSLYHKCMEVGAAFWPAAFSLVRDGFEGLEQKGLASYHLRGAPYNGEIDDSWPSEKIERFIRAMVFPPYPLASYRERFIRSIDEYNLVKGLNQ